MIYTAATQRQIPFEKNISASFYLKLDELLKDEKKIFYEASIASISVLGSQACEELKEMIADCSVFNWDGNNSNPINLASAIRAEKFLALLPLNISEPELSLDGDGQVIFQWFSKNRSVSILIKAEDEILFSDIDGINRAKGSIQFDTWFNEKLSTLIQSLE